MATRQRINEVIQSTEHQIADAREEVAVAKAKVDRYMKIRRDLVAMEAADDPE